MEVDLLHSFVKVRRPSITTAEVLVYDILFLILGLM
jgi:hypothetical protein